MTGQAGFIPLSKRRSILYTVGAVLSPVLAFVLGRLTASLLPEGAAWLYLYAAGLEVLMIGVPAVLLILRKNREFFPSLIAPSPESLGLVMLAAVSYVLTVSLVSVIWMQLTVSLGIPLPTEPALPAANSAGELALALLCAAAVPAVCEELFFRGLLLHFLLRKLTVGWAAFLCGLAFSLLHFSLRGFPALLMFGFVQSLLVIRYKSLWLAVAFHFLYNAVVIVLESLGGHISVQTVFLSAGIFAASLYLLFRKREA